MTREEYMRIMAMRAERQRAEYAEYYGEKIRREQERMAIKMFKEAQELAKEAEKPKKSAIALEGQAGPEVIHSRHTPQLTQRNL